jgi:glycogen operon protein
MGAGGDEERFGLTLNELLRHAEIDWHGVRLDAPDWGDESHSIACTLRAGSRRSPLWLHMMFNAYWEALDFDLPPMSVSAAAGWRRWIDTSCESPEDIVDIGAAPIVTGTQYRVAPRSIAALFVGADPQHCPTLGVADDSVMNPASA